MSSTAGPILQTARLSLEGWSLDDVDDAFSIWGDSEVMRFIGPPHESRARTRDALGAAIDSHARLGMCLWKLRLAAGATIGACGLQPHEGPGAMAPEARWLELAYHLRPDAWGHGYATEAAAACLQHAFDALGATRVVALIDPHHMASRRVIDKLGFRLFDREGDQQRFMYDGAR